MLSTQFYRANLLVKYLARNLVSRRANHRTVVETDKTKSYGDVVVNSS